MVRDKVVMHITQVMGGVHLHVRMYRPMQMYRFCDFFLTEKHHDYLNKGNFTQQNLQLPKKIFAICQALSEWNVNVFHGFGPWS